MLVAEWGQANFQTPPPMVSNAGGSNLRPTFSEQAFALSLPRVHPVHWGCCFLGLSVKVIQHTDAIFWDFKTFSESHPVLHNS